MSRRVGIIGGGVLGATLALRLAQRGCQVELFEAAPEIGGLAGWHDYGPFVWDRFYHCILPTDRHLVGLIQNLGLGDQLVWRQTGTGYFAGGRSYPMSKTSDYLRFPLLSWLDKARVGATVAYATKVADPAKLYSISAQDWLARWCGKRGYEVFWRPLLRAKFGPFYDQVAAVFIWATLTRLFGARSGAASREKLGYVRGGYRTILGRLESKLAAAGAVVHKRAPVTAIREPDSALQAASSADTNGLRRSCEIVYQEGGVTEHRAFDQVFFTGPTRVARSLVSKTLLPEVERVERQHPAGKAYLGVACLVLAVRHPLTSFYVLNVGDERIELTGIIEMTNLVDRAKETAGLSLIYVPQYMDSDDPRLRAEDVDIQRTLMDRGIKRIFPDLRDADLAYCQVHRTRYVQPLPLVRDREPPPIHESEVRRPFEILNTSMLRCATLNNDEVVAFVDHFVAQRGARWLAERESPLPAAGSVSWMAVG